jgi:hypothetical protein
MLTAEIKINGSLLKHLYVVNKGPVIPQDDTDLYHYNYTVVDTTTGENKKGTVLHKRRTGAVKLVQRILEEL